jgi:hypothetical protein
MVPNNPSWRPTTICSIVHYVEVCPTLCLGQSIPNIELCWSIELCRLSKYWTMSNVLWLWMYAYLLVWKWTWTCMQLKYWSNCVCLSRKLKLAGDLKPSGCRHESDFSPTGVVGGSERVWPCVGCCHSHPESTPLSSLNSAAKKKGTSDLDLFNWPHGFF